MPDPTHPAEKQHRRTLWIARLLAAGLTLIMLALLGRVVQLQWDPQPQVAQRVADRGRDESITARRGALLDRRGRVLAASRVGQRLFVDPQLIDDPIPFAAHVAHAIGADPARIDRIISRRAHTRYAVIDRLLSDEQEQAVRKLDLSGLGLQPRPVRHYPHGTTAGQVIGFVGRDYKGLDGVEFALDPVLRGSAGQLVQLRDAWGRPLWPQRTGYQPPRDGRDVRLSIDVVVQRIAERALAEACEEYGAKRAEAVVMDARNGQLLAMVNWPLFNPNDRGNVPKDLRRNRCVTDPYEPGSVFKPFIHAAATAAGLARPKQKIDTTDIGVWYSPEGRRLRDAHGHGTITWNKVLIYSSNIGMAKVASRLGKQRMHDVLGSFGFGQRTGTALPGESRGLVWPVDRWTHYSLTSIPMGQEIATTPVQLVRAFSAFANRGLIVSPTVLAAETDTPIYQRAVDADVADHTRDLLRRVVTEGTGRRAQSEQYRIWGKTGTAQVADRVNGGYLPRTYTASFICGAPLLDPKVIVLVTVHEPDPDIGYYGGIVSAPVAKQIVEQALPYLGVPPDQPGAGDEQRSIAAAR